MHNHRIRHPILIHMRQPIKHGHRASRNIPRRRQRHRNTRLRQTRSQTSSTRKRINHHPGVRLMLLHHPRHLILHPRHTLLRRDNVHHDPTIRQLRSTRQNSKITIRRHLKSKRTPLHPRTRQHLIRHQRLRPQIHPNHSIRRTISPHPQTLTLILLIPHHIQLNLTNPIPRLQVPQRRIRHLHGLRRPPIHLPQIRRPLKKRQVLIRLRPLQRILT